MFCERGDKIPVHVPSYFFKTVILPDTVKEIWSFAFSGCFELETVRLSASLEKINYRALFGCKNLKYIVIPENPVTLDYMNHFEEMNITIRSKKGSPAESYANEHGIPFEAE